MFATRCFRPFVIPWKSHRRCKLRRLEHPHFMAILICDDQCKSVQRGNRTERPVDRLPAAGRIASIIHNQKPALGAKCGYCPPCTLKSSLRASLLDKRLEVVVVVVAAAPTTQYRFNRNGFAPPVRGRHGCVMPITNDKQSSPGLSNTKVPGVELYFLELIPDRSKLCQPGFVGIPTLH